MHEPCYHTAGNKKPRHADGAKVKCGFWLCLADGLHPLVIEHLTESYHLSKYAIFKLGTAARELCVEFVVGGQAEATAGEVGLSGLAQPGASGPLRY